jgi:hypothetical protein
MFFRRIKGREKLSRNDLKLKWPPDKIVIQLLGHEDFKKEVIRAGEVLGRRVGKEPKLPRI